MPLAFAKISTSTTGEQHEPPIPRELHTHLDQEQQAHELDLVGGIHRRRGCRGLGLVCVESSMNLDIIEAVVDLLEMQGTSPDAIKCLRSAISDTKQQHARVEHLPSDDTEGGAV
jgi:hypothetical protein